VSAAAGTDFEDIRDELAKFAGAVDRQGDATARLLLAHNGELAKLWDEIAALRDAFLDDVRALSNRIEAAMKEPLTDYALQNDLDSLRSEMHAAIAEATATPFDPERPAA
jgi:methyl-accepting chemotaxis protein